MLQERVNEAVRFAHMQLKEENAKRKEGGVGKRKRGVGDADDRDNDTAAVDREVKRMSGGRGGRGGKQRGRGR